VALFSSDRFPHRLAITNGSIMVPSQACVVVPTRPPIRPRTLASSEKLTRLPPTLKPSISAFEEGHAGEAAKAVACVGAQAHRGGVETFGHPEGRRVDLIQMLVQQRVYEQTVSEVGRVRTHLAGATKFDMGQCIKPASEQHCYVTGG